MEGLSARAIDTDYDLAFQGEVMAVKGSLGTVVVELQTMGAAGALAEIEFTDVEGYRVLNERDLLEYWPTCSSPNGWLFEITSGGWLSQESERAGNISAKIGGLREFLVTGVEDCVSVLSRDDPKVRVKEVARWSSLEFNRTPCTVRPSRACELSLSGRPVQGAGQLGSTNTTMTTTVLYRPTGPKELELVALSGYTAWPPRLPEQPIFYPVTNEQYAIEIARDWNVKSDGCGFVTRFEVKAAFMSRYPIQKVGGAHHTEWWVPAEDLEELNQNLVGLIEIIHEFKTSP